ncbi:MAG: tetratricopeptide repeat protein [Thermovirgaceae bacterium]
MKIFLQSSAIVLIFAAAAVAWAGPLEEVVLKEIIEGEDHPCCWREVLMDITVGAAGSGLSEEDFLRLAPSRPALAGEAAMRFFEGQLEAARSLYEQARERANEADLRFYGDVIEQIQKALSRIPVGEGERNPAEAPSGPAPGEGHYRLGWKYKTGQGAERNLEKAFHWFEKAAMQGHAEAQFETARCYYFGEGVPEDLRQAARWFEEAAMQGHAEAQFYLGGLYWFGEGFERNEEKALNLWFLGAAKGEPDCQHNLAAHYFNLGEKDPANYRKAYYWYRQAAEGGLSGDQYMVGLMCEKGLGVKKDEHAALSWYKKAAAQGHEKARRRLSELGY